jgi:hypothetical protein
MIKQGHFATYQGNEYNISKNDDGTFQLISNNPSDQNSGFMPWGDSGRYVKTVKRNDIQSAYAIDAYCQYKGFEFGIDKEEDGKLRIFTGNDDVYEKLNLKEVDRSVYECWVKRDDLEKIWEKKRSIYGFPELKTNNM